MLETGYALLDAETVETVERGGGDAGPGIHSIPAARVRSQECRWCACVEYC